MKYRTKPTEPVVVDAFKYKGTLSLPALDKDFDEKTDAPYWVALAFLNNKLFYAPAYPNGRKALYAKDGNAEIKVGSYIVRNDEGAIFGCPADVFESCYEEIPLIAECKPIKTIDEILLMNESALTPEEKERLERAKRIPPEVRENFLLAERCKRELVMKLEKERDAILDYLNGFTDSEPKGVMQE